MRVKSGFMLREIAGQWIIVPLGARVVEFNGIMTLTESGAILWRLLEKGATQEEMLDALLKEYDVDAETAKRDITSFVDSAKSKKLLE